MHIRWHSSITTCCSWNNKHDSNGIKFYSNTNTNHNINTNTTPMAVCNAGYIDILALNYALVAVLARIKTHKTRTRASFVWQASTL